MRHAVIVEAVRTPIGRAHAEKGMYRDVRADDLSAHVMDALLKKANFPAADSYRLRTSTKTTSGSSSIRRFHSAGLSWLSRSGGRGPAPRATISGRTLTDSLGKVPASPGLSLMLMSARPSSVRRKRAGIRTKL